MMGPMGGLNCDGNVLLAAVRLGWMRRMICSVTWRLMRSSSASAVEVGGGAGPPGAATAGFPAASLSMTACCFWMIASCFFICRWTCRSCSFIASSSWRSWSGWLVCPREITGSAAIAATSNAATNGRRLNTRSIRSSLALALRGILSPRVRERREGADGCRGGLGVRYERGARRGAARPGRAALRLAGGGRGFEPSRRCRGDRDGSGAGAPDPRAGMRRGSRRARGRPAPAPARVGAPAEGEERHERDPRHERGHEDGREAIGGGDDQLSGGERSAMLALDVLEMGDEHDPVPDRDAEDGDEPDDRAEGEPAARPEEEGRDSAHEGERHVHHGERRETG